MSFFFEPAGHNAFPQDGNRPPSEWLDIIKRIEGEFRTHEHSPDSAQVNRDEELEKDEKARPFAETLMKEFKSALMWRSKEGKAFLHHLLKEPLAAKCCRRPVLEAMFESSQGCAESIECSISDLENKHPLTYAIEHEYYGLRHPLAEAMIDKLEKDKRDRQLSGQHGAQCIRAACKAMLKKVPFDINYVMKLVNWTTETMLVPDKDLAGDLIPLHYAVDYKTGFFNPDNQLVLVKLLLDRCEESIHFKVPVGNPHSSLISLYCWHRETQKDAKMLARGAIARLSSPREAAPSQQKATHENGNVEEPQKDPNKSGSESRSRRTAEQTAFSEKEEQRPAPHDPRQEEAANVSKADSIREELKRAEAASKGVVWELQHRYLRSSIETPSKEKDEQLDDYEAQSFFGEEMKDVQLGFYLKEHPNGQPVKEDRIKKVFMNRQLNKILAYVSLPQATVSLTLSDNPKMPPRPRYRDNRLFYFDWLHNTMKVDKIIKVIIDDMRSPLGDELIEEALAGKGRKGPGSLNHFFDVEILHWRKIDLCPKTVRQAAPNVRELHLEWSGNNSTLRGWSAIDGLPTLPMLRQIHLTYSEGNESSFRINENLQEFESQLNSNRSLCKEKYLRECGAIHSSNAKPNGMQSSEITKTDICPQTFSQFGAISIITHRILPSGAVDPTSDQGERRTGMLRPKWLNYMEEFVALVPHLAPKDESSPPPYKQVTVALIDDGVDLFLDEMERYNDQIMDPVSFDRSDDRHTPSAWYSRTGHGTLMAKLILAVCPWARIIPYRVLMRPDNDGRLVHPDPASAAKAIVDAIGRKVDIISMSWSVNGNLKDPGLVDLNEAFSKAKALYNITNRPLMFCAAADDGQELSDSLDNKEYPASCEWPKFRIGAATDALQTWVKVSMADKADFLFPGVDIPDLQAQFRYHHDSPEKLEKDPNTNSGSSIATALAAGQAALILHCVKLAIYYTNNAKGAKTDIQDAHLERMKTFDRMKKTFEYISVSNLTKQKVGVPAQQFESATKELKKLYEKGEADLFEQLVPVARLANQLIVWGQAANQD